MIRKRIVGLLLTVILSMCLLQMPVNAIVFSDVLQSDYYYYAVYWAYDEGVTAGTGPTTFSPNNSLTRAQVVTFLWKLAGSPADYQSYAEQFTDISPDAYYRKAVGWAVYYNITTGTGNGHFSPNGVITNKETITFMYKAASCNQITATSTLARTISLYNINSTAWYYNAVVWANDHYYLACVPAFSNGFLPNDITSRGLAMYLFWEMKTGLSNKVEVTIKCPSNQIIQASKYTLGAFTDSYYNWTQYRDVEEVLSSSKHYNCHGFAWYFCGSTTGILDEKAFLLDTDGVNQYAATSCYYQIELGSNTTVYDLYDPTNYSKLRPGDIIVLLFGDGDGNNYEGAYLHSEVIESIDGGSNDPITVLSKWDKYQVFRHYLLVGPYISTGQIINGNTVAVPCKVKVYRNKHYNSTNIIKDNSLVPVFDSTMMEYKFNDYYYYVNQNCHKKLCSCGRSYVLENHNFVLYGSSMYKCTGCGYKYNIVDQNNASEAQ